MEQELLIPTIKKYKEAIMAKRKKKLDTTIDPFRGQGQARNLTFVGNTPTEETFEILFERYKKAYDSQKGKLRRGEKMFLLRRNYNEFKDYYLAVANETPVSSTAAATANSIITRMVEESRYEYSGKQAKAYTHGLTSIGIAADLMDVRAGRYDREIEGPLAEAIEERGKELKREGKNSYEVRKQIGIEFFDSPT